MKTNRKTLQAAMDRRLSFLDDLPSCRAAVRYRIAQEEEPVMKKKISLGFVFAMVLVLLSVAALAAGLLLSPRATAVQTADRALEESRGITAEMMTFFGREEEDLPDGAVQVSYTGAGCMEYALGTYTVLVKDGKAEITWSHDGEDVSGGYDAEAWGPEQLKQMLKDCLDDSSKEAMFSKASAIAAKHGVAQDDTDTLPEDDEDQTITEEDRLRTEEIEAQKTSVLNARKLSEDSMIAIGREFIISNYSLDEEQAARMELYTNSFEDDGNSWYELVNGAPCFKVEYLLYAPYTTEMEDSNEPRPRMDKDGYYNVYVNVETGAVEEFEYNSALAGQG